MKCHYALCTNDVEIVPGHRQRKFCGDACRQNAYRDRLEEAARQAEERAHQERERQMKTSLRKEYGDLLPNTIELLYQLRQSGHDSLVQTIGRTILEEIEHARQCEAEQRNQLIEEIMLLGEKIGYSAMTLGRLGNISGPGEYALLGGVECWSSFVSNASIAMLHQARDTAYYHAEGYQRSRERLRELSTQS